MVGYSYYIILLYKNNFNNKYIFKTIYSVGGLGKVKKVIQTVDRNTIYFKYTEENEN